MYNLEFPFSFLAHLDVLIPYGLHLTCIELLRLSLMIFSLHYAFIC